MSSLEDVLSDKEPVVPADPVEPSNAEPVVVKTEENNEYKSRKTALQEKEWTARGMIRDPDTGQFVSKAPEEPKKEEPKPEPKVAAPEVKLEPKVEQPQFTEKERAFLAAAQEERRKRQELEARIKTMEAKPAEPPKGFWDDPEAAINAQKAEFQTALMKTRVDTSEMIARGKYQDFDEKANVFRDLVNENPWLYQQMMQSVDPADFAYKQAKNHLELKAAGSLDNMRAQIEKEVRMKIEAELKTKHELLEKERAALPSSLSDVRGTSVNKVAWGGPTSLENILKN